MHYLKETNDGTQGQSILTVMLEYSKTSLIETDCGTHPLSQSTLEKSYV